MRGQVRILTAVMLLLFTLIGGAVLYKIYSDETRNLCIEYTNELANRIIKDISEFKSTDKLIILSYRFPKDFSYVIYKENGRIYLKNTFCNYKTSLPINVSLKDKKIIGREKIYLILFRNESIIDNNPDKIIPKISCEASCFGMCCNINGTEKCIENGNCCNDLDCKNKITCVNGTIKCVKFNCMCSCPKDYIWNGTHCVKPATPVDPSKCDIQTLPEKFDWRNYNGKNWVTPVKNQERCGCCWAFATIGSLEARYNIEKGEPVNPNFSEQFLVSCCRIPEYQNRGCKGGQPNEGMRCSKEKGILYEQDFPYRARDIPCNPSKKPTLRIQQYNVILEARKVGNTNPSEREIERVKRLLVCYGPLAVGSVNWRHGITLVGYDDHSEICKKAYGKEGCWIIKNSWGSRVNGWAYGVYHINGFGYIPYRGHRYSDLVYWVSYGKGFIAK